MFHEGSLQSGISLAISQQKLVACFVRDDGDESSLWEAEWLTSGWLSSLLEQKAILLRLDAGSTEAGFLSAFCPISNIPTLLVIQNGQLREQITSGVTQNEFINRLRLVLGANAIPGTNPSSTSTSASTPAPALTPQSTQTPRPNESPAPAPVPAPAPASAPASAPTPSQTPPSIPASSPAPSAKSKGKQKAPDADPNPNPNRTSTIAAQQLARDALRKKKQEEKDELARIKARIEADKAERKAQAAARKAEREREAQTTPSSELPHAPSNRGSQAKEVNLNVRLFDGQTIRSKFPRTANLQDDVRPWIDQEFAANAEHPNQKHPPYFFKQIQAPLPSKELSTGEENETLGDVGLAPSATLVLIPVKGYTEAYSGSGGGITGSVYNGVTGIVGGAFGLVSGAVGYATGTLGSLAGYAPPSNAATESGPTLSNTQQPAGIRSDSPASRQAGGSVRVRTLADQADGASRDRLYNGNSLNFEPNEDGPGR